MKIIAGVGLAALAWADFKKKSIPVMPTMVWGVILLVAQIIGGGKGVAIIVGMIPGALLLLLAVASKEKIGIGDGVVTVCLGCGYPPEGVLSVLFAALLLAAVTAALLLLLKKAGRKTELPFLPFLLAGWIYGVIGGMV